MGRGRLGLSALDKREIWSRWKAGETLHEIGRVYGKCHNTIRAVLLPRGGTPLHDAIGRTIDGLGAKLAQTSEAERPGKVVIVIMTDGLENSSKEYSPARIAEMIKHQREGYKWEFVFLGANQDAILTGEKLNILRRSSMAYAATADGVSGALRATSRSLGSYRTGATKDMSFTQEDREKQNRAK